MGIFGAGKQKRIQDSIARLSTFGTPATEAVRYLGDHFTDAWPQLQELLLAATQPDPAGAALDALSADERKLLEQLARTLSFDTVEMAATLKKGGMTEPQIAAILPLLAALRSPSGRLRSAGRALEICTPFVGKAEVMIPVAQASLAMLGSAVPDAAKAAAEALEAVGSATLPALIALNAEGLAAATPVLQAVGRQYPQDLAVACAAAAGLEGVIAGLKALQVVGPLPAPAAQAHPASPWVAAVLAGELPVQDEAFAAAMAIGPTGECVAPARALLQTYPRKAADLLCAISPEGVLALAEEIASLDEKPAGAALAALKAAGKSGRQASAAVARVAERQPSLLGPALETLTAIGPTTDCIPLAEAALAEHTKAAAAMLCGLGAQGVDVIARRAQSMTDECFAEALPPLTALGPGAAPLAPRIAALLEGDKAVAQPAMQTLVALGPAARAAAAEILGYFRREASEVVAVQLADIADPSFLEPLLRFAYNTPRTNRGKLEEAARAFAETTCLGADTLANAVRASTFEHLFRGWKYDAGVISLQDSDAALGALLADRDPAVSAILHMVAGKKDVSETMETGCTAPTEALVSFREQRERATRELAARGNPPFDADAFRRPPAGAPRAGSPPAPTQV